MGLVLKINLAFWKLKQWQQGLEFQECFAIEAFEIICFEISKTGKTDQQWSKISQLIAISKKFERNSFWLWEWRFNESSPPPPAPVVLFFPVWGGKRKAFKSGRIKSNSLKLVKRSIVYYVFNNSELNCIICKSMYLDIFLFDMAIC